MRLLVTAAGTGTAFSYATAIAKNFSKVKLYSADTSSGDFVTSSLYAEEHFQTRSIYEDDFYNELSRIIEENKINHYIPLIDEETVKAHSFSFLKARLAANGLEFCEKCIEKNNYDKSFKVEGIKFPQVIDDKDIVDTKEYIAKKNGGFGGRSTKLLQGSEVSKLESDFTLYQLISGDEYTIDCFPLNNSVVTSIRMRVEVKNGVCTKAKIIRNEILEFVALQICQKYKLKHPFCFQVIKKNKDFYLIDVNPRLGAGSAISATNGLDFFSAHVALLVEQDPKQYLNRHHESCIVTRQYANYLTKVL